MTEYELNAFHSEFDPVKAAESLKQDPSRENKVKNFAVLKTSYFLTFARTAENLAVLNDKKGGAFVPLFTCRAELEKWPFERTEVIEVTYERAKSVAVQNARLDGLVINPFGNSMTLRRQQLTDVDFTMQTAAHGDKRQIQMKATLDYPMGLPLALEALLKEHPEVYRVWLMAAHSEGEHLDHKLFIVDFDGQPQPLFGQITEAIKLYLRAGEPVEMMKADLKLLQIADKATRPLYVKQD